VPKDKKAKKKDGKKAKRSDKLAPAPAVTAKALKAPKAAKALKPTKKKVKAVAQSPLVAEVIAAALVATAAALRDSNKARALAEQTGDALAGLEKTAGERGSALWQLALDIGRRVAESAVADVRKAGQSADKAKS
jgi:hypothetical protein